MDFNKSKRTSKPLFIISPRLAKGTELIPTMAGRDSLRSKISYRCSWKKSISKEMSPFNNNISRPTFFLITFYQVKSSTQILYNPTPPYYYEVLPKYIYTRLLH